MEIGSLAKGVPMGGLPSFHPENNIFTTSTASGTSEEIRTIFVLGFPPDVKEREFWNLVKWWPGYEACMMDFKGEQPLGFARFKTALQAREAMHMIQTVVLDEDGVSRTTLRAEMARKNLYVRPSTGVQNGGWNKSIGDPRSPPKSPPHATPPPMYSTAPFPMNGSNPTTTPPSYFTPVMVPTGYTHVMAPWTLQNPPWPQPFAVPPPAGMVPVPFQYAQQPPMRPPPVTVGYPVGMNSPGAQQIPMVLQPLPGVQRNMSGSYFQPTAYASMQSIKDNPPCNTLFIGNLGVGTTEAEIRALFSSFSGFRQLKILRSTHGTICFVEYQDIPTAAFVHNSMQGAILNSSDRGGMRIQFSRNPFGCRGAPDGERANIRGSNGSSHPLRSGGRGQGNFSAEGGRRTAMDSWNAGSSAGGGARRVEAQQGEGADGVSVPLEMSISGSMGQELKGAETEMQSRSCTSDISSVVI